MNQFFQFFQFFRSTVLLSSVFFTVAGQAFALNATKPSQSPAKPALFKAKPAQPIAKTLQANAKTGSSKAGQTQAKVAPPLDKADQGDDSGQTAPSVDAHCEPLAGRVRDYRTNPDVASWDALLRDLRAFIAQPQTAHLSQAVLFAANPGLVDIGTKITDFSSGRIWSFPRINECQHLLLQWQNVTPGPEEAVLVRGKRRIVRGTPKVSWRSELVHVPGGVQIKEARIVGSSQVTTVGKKVTRVDSPKSLVLVGLERTGNSYLQAFRASGGMWNEATDVFSGVPPYVLQSLAGKTTFSGNDLVLSIGGSAPTPPPLPNEAGTAAGEKKPAPVAVSNGYRLVLKLVNGKYQMEGGKNGEDGAFATVAQFSNALQQGRPDIAKAWLADPKLISIPKYIGYFGKSVPTPRLIPMANPLNGFNRYRLITSMKEDLIIDVGRAKSPTFAIKALFIAPPDPLASRILSNLQAHDAAAATPSAKDKDKDDSSPAAK